MSKQTPDHTVTTETFHNMKVKNLKPGDRITIGLRGTKVIENVKNSIGGRVLKLQTLSNQPKALTLIVPNDFEMVANRITRTSSPKK